MQSMENRVTEPPLGRDGSLMTTEITVASAMAAAEKTSFFVVFGFDIKKSSFVYARKECLLLSLPSAGIIRVK